MLKKCSSCGLTEYCTVCEECHACRYSKGAKKSGIRTQKATGIFVLADHGYNVPEWYLVQTREDLEKKLSTLLVYEKKVFVRPCPIKPRHGFVDSRIVSSINEGAAIWDETIAEDPLGEVVLMVPVKAAYNCVIRPGLMSVGTGNAGATAGEGVIDFPLVGVFPKEYDKMAKAAHVPAHEDPYFEIVFRKPDLSPYFTQLRAGPRVDAWVNYIPYDVVVKRVVKAGGTWLEWEKTISELTEGDVVWHPGGGMGSHYAVHCQQNKIPIVTSFEPQVGEAIAKVGRVSKLNPKIVKYGIAAASALAIPENMRTSAVCAILYGLHNSAKMHGNLAFFVGAAMGLMHKLGTAACLGEARHASSTTKSIGRDSIYEKCFTQPILARNKLPKAIDLFVNHHWGGSFGGKPWADCGKAIVKLDEAMLRILRDPTEEAVHDAVEVLNEAVNKAHNNGWWLNKFAEQEYFDFASKGDPKAWINAVPILMKLDEVSGEAIYAALLKWQGCKTLEKAEVMPKPPEAAFACICGASIVVAFPKMDKRRVCDLLVSPVEVTDEIKASIISGQPAKPKGVKSEGWFKQIVEQGEGNITVKTADSKFILFNKLEL